MVEIGNIASGHHGIDMDNWSADSGSEGAGPSGLHLHHHGGLPRTLHLHHLCRAVKASQRSVRQMLEGKGQ